MISRTVLFGSLLTVLAVSTPARAETDWFASLYTQEGVELRADERVFAAYALLNAMGYSEAPIIRKFPVPVRDMHAVRQKVRREVKLDAALEQKIATYFDKHPMPADAYGRYILATKGPANFERMSGATDDLKEFEGLVAGVYQTNKLGEMFAGLQDDYRTALKAYHKDIDGPIAAIRKVLKPDVLKMTQDDATRLILVVNLLDGRGAAYSTQIGNDLYVVVGPSPKPDTFGVVREFARAKLAPAVAKKGPLKGLTDQAAAAGLDNPPAFILEGISRAFACSALNLSEAEVNAQSQDGYWAVPAILQHVRAYEKGDKTFESFLNDAIVAMAITKEPPKDVPGPGKSGAKAK